MKVEITFPCEEPKKVIESLKPELEFDQRERSKVEIQEKTDAIIITITATDPVAARASANSYLKMLYLQKKVDKI